MSDKDKAEDQLLVREADDGSATVNISEELLGNDAEDQSVESKQADSSIPSEDMDHPDDDEELRAAKRNRRKAKKELIRKTNQEKDLRLQHLARENEEIKRKLDQLERNTQAEQINKIDNGIQEALMRVEYAKQKHAEAIEAQDGHAANEAKALWDESKAEAERLNYIRQQADAEFRQPKQQPKRQMPTEVQKHAVDWMKRNPWYKPDISDSESRIAKKIDEILVAQGWDPADADYWDELDSRLQRELPHVYNNLNDDGSRNVRRPRNVVGSSGREASAAYGGSNRTQISLSPERVRAMKEAGAWDNPERKARMIKQFIAYDRSNGRRN